MLESLNICTHNNKYNNQKTFSNVGTIRFLTWRLQSSPESLHLCADLGSYHGIYFLVLFSLSKHIQKTIVILR